MTSTCPPLSTLEREAFSRRHIGPSDREIQRMLEVLALPSLEALMDAALPSSLRAQKVPTLDPGRSEAEALATLKDFASQNRVGKSYLGMGYHPTRTPAVIQRNVFENPSWYTAYTPYQPEIAQGRLEALLTFQQLTLDLTGMDLASASLLDEGTAAAEAMALARRVSKSGSKHFFVDENCHPQTLDVIKTRSLHIGVEVRVGVVGEALAEDCFGLLLAYPGSDGALFDPRVLIEEARQRKVMVSMVTDPLSLMLLRSPGELGADIALGSAQRFGIPMGYGGPHPAYFAVKAAYKRALPGRVIGVSKDSRGRSAYRMVLQTREQHIRREKATSNICTSQVLLANMAAFYAVYHGPSGLKKQALRVHQLTNILAAGLRCKGVSIKNRHWFDTLSLEIDASAACARALEAEVYLRRVDSETLTLSLNETTTAPDIEELWDILLGTGHGLRAQALERGCQSAIPAALWREDNILSHEVFHKYRSETAMMRYLKQLEDKDLALNYSMIPLGSCTMKLNATTEMLSVSWPGFADLHPFCPPQKAEGYKEFLADLQEKLCRITGFDAICLQPNSGAQGEFAGLMAIRGYQSSRGESARRVCLIPSSAHGTNPASAQMAGLEVMVIPCDKEGNVDLEKLRGKARELGAQLSCLMITYPSTHGVYEENIMEICSIIHAEGGQVYMDGANLNALVGVARPAEMGVDVLHMNLHKTFCIPHGGGGPGMGPIGVKEHLSPFVAGHSVVTLDGPFAKNGAVSSAPYGSASILPISWSYIHMMGTDLKKATQVAILSANYVAHRLQKYYPLLYKGKRGMVAHECIIDLRPIKATTGITEEDVAKRLMDYGFHAPTMSFPVPGTLMIEPTESENLGEIEEFIDALISIRKEIERVASGRLHASNNMLKNAPHSLVDMTEEWTRPYPREEAVFPNAKSRRHKFWPAVNRVDNAYGDRNLFCACIPTADYEAEAGL